VTASVPIDEEGHHGAVGLTAHIAARVVRDLHQDALGLERRWRTAADAPVP